MQNTTHLVCTHCQATNRIPTERLNDAPKCGKCHAYLFTGQPIELTSTNFQNYMANNDIPILVDFWAPWCGPCKMMAPYFAEAAKQLEPHIRLAKINTEDEQQLGAKHHIRSIPTLILFGGGYEIARHAGAMGTVDIIRWVQSHT
ncbi:MAG: thioredoxin TrxC [Gammaproteobacteria bacterium]|nr:thioredoxin TrxC [Gammaproteobacteria bacterium]